MVAENEAWDGFADETREAIQKAIEMRKARRDADQPVTNPNWSAASTIADWAQMNTMRSYRYPSDLSPYMENVAQRLREGADPAAIAAELEQKAGEMRPKDVTYEAGELYAAGVDRILEIAQKEENGEINLTVTCLPDREKLIDAWISLDLEPDPHDLYKYGFAGYRERSNLTLFADLILNDATYLLGDMFQEYLQRSVEAYSNDGRVYTASATESHPGSGPQPF